MLPLLINEGAGAWKDSMKSHDQLTVEPRSQTAKPISYSAAGCIWLSDPRGVLLPFSFYRMLVIMTRFWRRHLLKYLLHPGIVKRRTASFMADSTSPHR